MEYIAKITKEEKISKQFWRYTFIDVKTSEIDYFINNYRINYIPNLEGKLKVVWDKKKQHKLFQSFEQDPSKVVWKFQDEEELEWLENILGDKTKKVPSLTKRPIKYKHRDYIDFINRLHESGVSWKTIAKAEKRTDRMLRYRRKPVIKSLKKVGPKWKFDRKDLYCLISYLFAKRATLQEMKEYLLDKREKEFSIPTIYRVLKKIKYSYQVIHYRNPKQKVNLAEVLEFMEKVSELPPRQLLATDESGHPLNLAPKKAWGKVGGKITDFKEYYAINYSLILLIRNLEKKGIIRWKLVEGAVDTKIFTNFINGVKLSKEEKYYLLLDRLSVHKTEKVKEALNKKNIEPRYIIACNPYLNPVEELFNVIKGYVKKQRATTEKELRSSITKIINILRKDNLRKYFRDCLDYDFVFKSGH